MHATFRQNYGVNYMLIGRDHAGVGDFYGLFEAQTIFDRIPQTGDPKKDLLCKPMKIDWTFYCHKCDGMASLRTCPHTKDDRVILSGTKLRKALSDGAEVVDHFGREEVLVVLRKYYEGLTEKVEVKMQGAASGSSNVIFDSFFMSTGRYCHSAVSPFFLQLFRVTFCCCFLGKISDPCVLNCWVVYVGIANRSWREKLSHRHRKWVLL